MMIDGKVMKILEIRDSKGYYRTSNEAGWEEIDTIDKDGLMALLDHFLLNEVEMDPPDQDKLQNQAQQIVYKSIFDKLDALRENKSKFKDESDRKYLKEIQKYSDRGEISNATTED